MHTLKNPLNSRCSMAGTALALAAAALLGGCVVAPPPPPRVYERPPPPPPPAYVEPAADVEVQANEAPPPLPDYEQPPCPEDGYMWTPGYWAWGGGEYYWVPGTWVQPPRVGVLWTPGYWAFTGGIYAFHAGYWGPHIGYYGGVNYGYGYVGVGFAGGRWEGNRFAYNRAVNNVNVTVIHNTYNETVVNNVTVNRVSYNGGPSGTRANWTPQERAAAAEQHVPATQMQHQHVQEAIRNPALAARINGGHPAIAATPRPAAFNAPGIIGARGAAAPPAGAGRTPGQPGQQNGGQQRRTTFPRRAWTTRPTGTSGPDRPTGTGGPTRPTGTAGWWVAIPSTTGPAWSAEWRAALPRTAGTTRPTGTAGPTGTGGTGGTARDRRDSRDRRDRRVRRDRRDRRDRRANVVSLVSPMDSCEHRGNRPVPSVPRHSPPPANKARPNRQQARSRNVRTLMTKRRRASATNRRFRAI